MSFITTITPDQYQQEVHNKNTYRVTSGVSLDGDAIIKIMSAWTAMQICMEEAYTRNSKFNSYILLDGEQCDYSVIRNEGETSHYLSYIRRTADAKKALDKVLSDYQITHFELVGDYVKWN